MSSDLLYWSGRAANLSEMLHDRNTELREAITRATDAEQRADALQRENDLLMGVLRTVAARGVLTPDDLPSIRSSKVLGWNWRERRAALMSALFPKRVITLEEAASVTPL